MERTFTLVDIPPTSNHRLMPVQMGKGLRLVKTPEYRHWMEQAVISLSKQNLEYRAKIFNERVAVFITVLFPDKRRRDIDNLLKPVNDALTKAGIIADDSLIDYERVMRLPVNPEGGAYESGLEIIVSPYVKMMPDDVKRGYKRASKRIKGFGT